MDAHPDTDAPSHAPTNRSEEHTSELQSRLHLVCRLLLEKKKEEKKRKEKKREEKKRKETDMTDRKRRR